MYYYSNIDIRIRQAELEYALGREELHLLSLAEEIRALQCRLDKSLISNTPKNQKSLFYQLSNGLNMSLYAVNANVGGFGLNMRDDGSGIYIDWVSEGESLFRGDRIIECNGKFIYSQTKDEIQNLLGSNGNCELVVVRTRTNQQSQMLLQSQEDNRRLQHRISYLEDQVKELQHSTKDRNSAPELKTNHAVNRQNFKGDHVTSINISAPSSQDDDNKPQIFQRGNFIATIVGGKAVQTASKPSFLVEASTPTNKMSGCVTPEYEHCRHQGNALQHSQSQQFIGSHGKIFGSTSKISINNGVNGSHSFLKQRDKSREHYKENHRTHRGQSDRHNSHPDLLYADVSFIIYN